MSHIVFILAIIAAPVFTFLSITRALSGATLTYQLERRRTHLLDAQFNLMERYYDADTILRWLWLTVQQWWIIALALFSLSFSPGMWLLTKICMAVGAGGLVFAHLAATFAVHREVDQVRYIKHLRWRKQHEARQQHFMSTIIEQR